MKSRQGMLLIMVFLLLTIMQAIGFAAEPAPARASDPDVDFRWAFAALSVRDGKTDVQPVSQDTTLKSGDQLKMMVELQRRCFVYVFHYNPKDGLKLIFPYTLQQFASDYEPNHKYYVPRGDAWFKLDNNPGQETFYLLSSAKRLEELEAAYLKYESADPALKGDAARVVLDQIRSLRREHRELTAPAERPVPIGGALRGVEKIEDPTRIDIAALADEIISTGFVARTFTIEHK